MNVKNLVRAIQIIEEKSKEGLIQQPSNEVSFIFYDEQFYNDKYYIRNNKNPDHYKRSIGAWLSYEMNPKYPNSWVTYGRAGLLQELSLILEIPVHEVRHICVQINPHESIEFIKKLLAQVPRSELIKHIDG